MLIDTHCHLNMMVKRTFDTPLSLDEIHNAQPIIHEALQHQVTTIINVGTSLVESLNCVELAKKYTSVFAAIGIHPNDCSMHWRNDLDELAKLLLNKENKIVAIGECGLDKHYPDYNLQRQKDAFKAQIELALEHNLALIVHTRQAGQETLQALQEFKGQLTRGIIHCFSEDLDFAHAALDMGLVIGIGGTLTYPKNNLLRTIAQTLPLTSIVLETDAPFLPPQNLRGKQNHPLHIATIAHYLATLRNISIEEVSTITTQAARKTLNLPVTD